MACENKNCGSCDCDTPEKGKTFDMATKKVYSVPDTVEVESAIVDEGEAASEHAFGTILLGFMMAWFLSSFT
jgi:hypothetical protein